MRKFQTVPEAPESQQLKEMNSGSGASVASKPLLSVGAGEPGGPSRSAQMQGATERRRRRGLSHAAQLSEGATPQRGAYRRPTLGGRNDGDAAPIFPKPLVLHDPLDGRENREI